mmetsp:Transcript_42608/g.120383  ORF Transcript_42608/g.120383 Transcript_42608/m.120383 type:complete len:119 (+) Transcript_42608:206-562(+)
MLLRQMLLLELLSALLLELPMLLLMLMQLELLAAAQLLLLLLLLMLLLAPLLHPCTIGLHSSCCKAGRCKVGTLVLGPFASRAAADDLMDEAGGAGAVERADDAAARAATAAGFGENR